MAIAPQPTAEMPVSNLPSISDDELHRRNRAAIALLDEWDRTGDIEEQRETTRVIREALGEKRAGSSRSLFP